MDGAIETGRNQGQFDILVKSLGFKNPRKHDEAVAILCRVGRPIVPPLVHEAMKSGKRSQQRIAILNVVQQIGGRLGFDELCGLQSLLRHRDPGVCQKAEQVIMSLSPGGLPKSPEEAAFTRAVNPFLSPLPRRPQRKRRYYGFPGL